MIQKEQRYLKMSDGKDLYTYIWSDTDITPKKAIMEWLNILIVMIILHEN